VVLLDKFECLCAGADLFGDAVQFVIEDVAQALSEDQRKDEILKLRRFLCATDAARRIPYPGLQRLAIPVRYHSPATKLDLLITRSPKNTVGYFENTEFFFVELRENSQARNRAANWNCALLIFEIFTALNFFAYTAEVGGSEIDCK